MTSAVATELNNTERRIMSEIADFRAEVNHDIQLLDARADVTQRVMSEQMDRGFQQVIGHIDRWG